MAEQVTAEVMSATLGAIVEKLPGLAKRLRSDILRTMVKHAQANIRTGNQRYRGPKADQARYLGAAMKANAEDDGESLTTGLPDSDEMARILAFREEGGTITPKNDRPNPHLRIPLEPALTGAGYDRNLFPQVRLRDERGTEKERFRLIPTPHAPKASAILVLKGDKTREVKDAESKKWRRAKGTKERKQGRQPAWYALVKSVTQRGTHWLRDAGAATNAEVEQIISARLVELEKGRAG